MSEELRAVNIKIPADVYKKLKFLAIVNNATMKDIIIEAIIKFQEVPKLKEKVRNLKHMLYRLKRDREFYE